MPLRILLKSFTLAAVLAPLLMPGEATAQRVRARSPEADSAVEVTPGRRRRGGSRVRSGVRAEARLRGPGVEGRLRVQAPPPPRVVIVEHDTLGGPPAATVQTTTVQTATVEEVPERPPSHREPRRSRGVALSSLQFGYVGGWDNVGEVQHGVKLQLGVQLVDQLLFFGITGVPARYSTDARGRATNIVHGTAELRLAHTLAYRRGRFYGVLATGGGAFTYPDQDREAVGVWVSQIGLGVEFGGPTWGETDMVGGFIDVRAEAWVPGGGLEARFGVAWSTGVTISYF